MKLVLLAGPSGSGKSRLAREVGALTLRLDDFYFDADHPGLPLTSHGFIDWDDAATWDVDAAAQAVAALAQDGTAEVPVYSIAESKRVGEQTVRTAGHHCVIAEGIFAIELLPALRARGISVDPLYLDRSRTLVALLRLRRDLAKHRKPVGVLLRRGLDLWHAQPALRARAIGAGFVPLSMRAAVRRLTGRTANAASR